LGLSLGKVDGGFDEPPPHALPTASREDVHAKGKPARRRPAPPDHRGGARKPPVLAGNQELAGRLAHFRQNGEARGRLGLTGQSYGHRTHDGWLTRLAKP
jgi:hypothetical protein